MAFQAMLPTPYTKCDYDKVYEPSEDSFLLLDSLEKDRWFLKERFPANEPAIVCELGPGSGVVTSFMLQNGIPNTEGSLYFAIDINPFAIEATVDTAKRNNVFGKRYLDVVQGSLTDSIRPGQIDCLVFNPPYVPSEESPKLTADWLDLALIGGKDGMEVTDKVLQQLDTILSPRGVAYILFCARNNPELVAEEMASKHGWEVELVRHTKAGWEVLSVYRFSR